MERTVAQSFLDYWIMPYGTPTTILTDNGSKFVGKFFAAVCVIMRIKELTTMAYITQTNVPMERYNTMIVSRLRHNFA